MSKLTQIAKMNNNCRWGEVILLDGRSVEILIQPRLFAGDLFDTVASHFDLKEKEYFGLAFLDETGQYNWLNLERRVLEHEYAQKVDAPVVNAKANLENRHQITKSSSNINDTTPSFSSIQLSSSSDQIDGLKSLNTKLAQHSSSFNNHHQNSIVNHQIGQHRPTIRTKSDLSDLTTTNTKANAQQKQHRLLTKSTSRLPTVSKIKSLKNKKTSTTVVESLKRPLARLINQQVVTNGPQPQSTVKCTEKVPGTRTPSPPPLPSMPPPPLPLVLDTPEMISIQTPIPVNMRIPTTTTTVTPTIGTNDPKKKIIFNDDDDPLYDVIAGDHCETSTKCVNIDDNDDCSDIVIDHHANVGVAGQRFSTTTTGSNETSQINDYSELLSLRSATIVHNGSGHDDNIVGDYPEQLDIDIDKQPQQQQEDRLVLYFLVKYFVESITMLQDTNTIELFYLQAKSLLINEIVQVDLETSLKLLALILQATYGDCNNYHETKIRNRMHRLQLISSNLLNELSTYQNCEDHILDEYRHLTGISHGESIFRFMTLIEKQPTYGVHFYEVKDKTGNPYWLGLSFKGIDQFSYMDRRLPLKQFAWKQLENLYFREKKFSIEVRDLKRVVHTLSSINLYENAIEDPDTFDDLSTAICDPTTQVSVSRRTFGPCNVTVYVWFAASSSLTKCIWSMAIAQHQFYIDRRINKSIKLQRAKEEIVRCLDENYRLGKLFQKSATINNRQRNSYSCSSSSIVQRASLYSNSSFENGNISNFAIGLERHSFCSTPSSSNTATTYSSTNSLNNQQAQPVPTLINNNNNQPQYQQKSSSLISLNQMENNNNNIGSNNSTGQSVIGSTSGSSSSVCRHNSQTLLQSSNALQRHTPFRHSTSTSSIHKMISGNAANIPLSSSSSSNSNSNLNNIKCSKMNRLRYLQSQLKMKLDELNRLDLLEQQILLKAARNAPHSTELLNDASSTMTTVSSSSSSSSSSFNQQNQNRFVQHGKLISNNILPKQTSNSLKNFVVTGRASSSLSQVHGQQSQQYHYLPQTDNNRLTPNSSSLSTTTTTVTHPITSIQHQRSKSVGVSSRFSLDRKKSQPPLPSMDKNYHSMSTKQLASIIDQKTNQNILTNNPSGSKLNNINQMSETLTKPPPLPPAPSGQSLLFHSPYVNKYDSSMQNLLNDNERTNLYSVPNRRTSVALNSLDDTALQHRTNNSQTIQQQNILDKNKHHQPRILLADRMGRMNLNQNRYSIVTTSVTSSTNTLTYSTLSYKFENVANKLSPINVHHQKQNKPLVESSVDDCSTSDVLDNSSITKPMIISSNCSNSTYHHQQRTSISSHHSNMDEENLANYKSFLLRSNSLSSNRSIGSTSTQSAVTGGGGGGEHSVAPPPPPLPPLHSAPKPMVNGESNYVNYMGPSVNMGSNSDYVNLLSTKTAMVPEKPTVNGPTAVPTILVNNGDQFSNHIYQNSQSLLSMLNQNVNNNISSLNTNQNAQNLSPRRRPKTWFETDLDSHAKNQIQQQQSSNGGNYIESNCKPLFLKQTNNLVFNDRQNDQKSTIIYHPIRLVVNNDDDNNDSGHDNDDHHNDKGQELHDTKQNYLNHGNHYRYVSQKNLSDNSRSPTPSQMSSNSTMNGFNSMVYSNLLPPIPSVAAIQLDSSSIDPSLSELSSSNAITNATPSTTSMVQSRIARAISPICTVAFVPPTTVESTTTMAVTGPDSTTVPIASCKGNIVEVDIVTVGHFQPGYEETKPFTMSDFYKYSQRYRQQMKNKTNNEQQTELNKIVSMSIGNTNNGNTSNSISEQSQQSPRDVSNDDNNNRVQSTNTNTTTANTASATMVYS